MRRNAIILCALAVGLVAAAGCSSSGAAIGSDKQYGYPAASAAATIVNGEAAYNGSGTSAAPAATGAPVAYPSSGGAVPSAGAGGPEDRIIKTGQIHIQVANVDDSITRATDQMHALGGWMAGSNRSNSTAGSLASVTYRVPADRFEDAVAQMRKLGTKVLDEHSDSAAVGGQIVDLQARIENLKASEKAIQAIMAKANTIGDVLTVEQRLAEVRGQIEELSAQLASLTDQSAYSTLTVVFEAPALVTPSPSPTPSPTPEPTATPVAWNAGTQFDGAAGALTSVAQSAATVAIWVVVLVLPVMLALLILLVIGRLVARVVDPYRKRLLPFTVARPVSYGPTGWQAAGQQHPLPQPPLPQQPGQQPDTDPTGQK